MANYFDTTHIDGKKLTLEEIGDAIRHKKFGVDVREAMAQGLEYCMRQAQKVDTLETEVKNLDERVTNNGEIAKLKTAVFGDGAIPIDDPVFEDNHDKRAQEVHFD